MSRRAGSIVEIIRGLAAEGVKNKNRIYSEARVAGGDTRLWPAKDPKKDKKLKVRIDEIFFNPVTKQKMIAVQLNREVDQKTRSRVINNDTHVVLARAVINTNWTKEQEGERSKEWDAVVASIVDQVEKETPIEAVEFNMPGYKESIAMAALAAQEGKKLSRSEKKKEKEAEAAQNQRSRSNSRTRINSRPPTRGSGGGGDNSH